MSSYHTKKVKKVQEMSPAFSMSSCYTRTMSTKTAIWLGATVGSTLGGMMPTIWGDSGFSTATILLSTAGGFLGIYLGYKVSQMMG